MINIRNERFTLVGALQRHKRAWQELMYEYELDDFATYATPTTVSWKVADKGQLYADLGLIAKETEQVHIGTVNERFIASALLHEPLETTMWIIKILERRPGSIDKLGLDSVDYLVKDIEQTYSGLRQAGLRAIKESNDMHSWLSLRFGENEEFEAKFTDHLVLQVAQAELKLSEAAIIKRLNSK